MKNDASIDDGFEIVSSSIGNSWRSVKAIAHGILPLVGFMFMYPVPHFGTATHGSIRYQSRAFTVSSNVNLMNLRFMKLIYDNQRQVERISGRSNNSYASFEDKGNLVRKVKYGTR
jgi:hypothetical protein